MLVLFAVACTTDLPKPITETGNPERVMGVAASPVEAPPSAATVESAWAGLNGTKLILDEQYVGEHELEWETDEIVADLAAGPVDLRFRSPDAGYTTVVIRPKDGRDGPSEAPDELEDATFVVEGTAADGTPFRVVSAYEEEIVLTRPFELRHETRSLALGFDTNVWLEGLDLQGAEVDGDGVVQISSGRNPDLLRAFEANLAPSVSLVEDLDEDGEVGEGDPVLSAL